MHRGYIKLWRKAEDCEFHPSKEKRTYTKWEAWEYMLVSANHKEQYWVGLKCKRGELLFSLDHYADKWKWSRTKVWRFLKHLEKRNAIVTANETVTTRVTISNYELYQSNETKNETQVKRKVKRERNASETQAETTKECNTLKNEKKSNSVSDEEFILTLKANASYKHIDIDRELGKMDAWLCTRKGRQKTRKFIVNWLNNIDPPVKSGGFRIV